MTMARAICVACDTSEEAPVHKKKKTSGERGEGEGEHEKEKE